MLTKIQATAIIHSAATYSVAAITIIAITCLDIRNQRSTQLTINQVAVTLVGAHRVGTAVTTAIRRTTTTRTKVSVVSALPEFSGARVI